MDNKFNENDNNKRPEEEYEKDLFTEYEYETNLLDEDEEKFKNENIDTSYNGNQKKKEKKKKRKFKGSLFSYIIVVLLASIIGGIVSPFIGSRLYDKIVPEEYINEYKSEVEQINISPKDDITTVTAVAKKAMSSVVGITTLEEIELAQPLPFWFYGPEVREGIGSGVIVDSNGYILTNSHVVADGKAKEINVLFDSGEKEIAELIWYEPSIDLAVIKVNKTGLPLADLGDSDKLEIGELAVAIGNPLGLEFQQTVTDGIVSGLNRTISIEGRVIENLIQTNASINPGNSGGPLLNGEGQVIGINTAKIKGGEGIGFAIPINQAKEIVEEIIETGSYNKNIYSSSRGTVILGISSYSAKQYQETIGIDLGIEKGIIIVKVHEGTPAHKAGLLNGDILTKIGDIEIESIEDLIEGLENYSQGDKETLTIIRTGQEINVQVEFSQVN